VTITKFSASPTGFLSSRTRDNTISELCDDHGGHGGSGSGSGSGHGGGDDGNGHDNGNRSGRGGPSRCLNSTVTITSAACAASDTACSSCGLAYATIDACGRFRGREPEGGLRSPSDIAALCLCYSGAGDNSSALTWQPNLFDAPYSYCPQWASTGDPSHLRDYSTGVNYCSIVGNILNATVTDMASSASASLTATGTGGAITATGSSTGVPSASQVGSNTASGGFDARVSQIKQTLDGDGLTCTRDQHCSLAYASQWYLCSFCDRTIRLDLSGHIFLEIM
jgi:hypothetical protein